MGDSLHLVERVTRVETNIADIKDDISEIKGNIKDSIEEYRDCQKRMQEKLNLLLADHDQRKTYERIGQYIFKAVGAAVLTLSGSIVTIWLQGRGH